MSNFTWGAGITAGLGFIASIIYFEIRFRLLQTKLIVTQQAVTDEKAVNNAHDLSLNELSALLDKDLGPGDPKAK